MGTSPDHLTILAHELGHREMCPVAGVDVQALLPIVEKVLHHLAAH